MRQCIERAFGLLTQRWGIFWRVLKVAYEKWALICSVAAKLHNFCIDQKIAVVSQRHDDDVLPGDVWEVLDNHPKPNEDDGGRGLIRPTGCRRRNITASLQEKGIRRPAHASMNSRA